MHAQQKKWAGQTTQMLYRYQGDCSRNKTVIGGLGGVVDAEHCGG